MYTAHVLYRSGDKKYNAIRTTYTSQYSDPVYNKAIKIKNQKQGSSIISGCHKLEIVLPLQCLFRRRQFYGYVIWLLIQTVTILAPAPNKYCMVYA